MTTSLTLTCNCHTWWQWHMSVWTLIVTSVIFCWFIDNALNIFIFQFLQLGSLQARSLSGSSVERGVTCRKLLSYLLCVIQSFIWRATCSLQVFTLPQMETFLIVPGESGRMSTIIGNRKNLHHSGTTSGNSLQECSKSSLKDVPLLPTSDKHAILGTARVKDESRATNGARGWALTWLDWSRLSLASVLLLTAGLDVPGMEPLDYSVMDQKSFEELIHRFRPKAMVLLTASCPSIMRPLLEAQIPVVAICAMAVTHVSLTD